MGYAIERFVTFLPIVRRDNIVDLELSFTVTPASPQAGTPAQIAVTVTNNGTSAANNFWVDFYINPSEVPTVNKPWNEICDRPKERCFGLAWFISQPLAPGQSIVLNSSVESASNPNGYRPTASNWLGYFDNDTSKLYALVDSWNRDAAGTTGDPFGAIVEVNENNNRAEQDIIVTPGTLPPLPAGTRQVER
ncbi:hypothetical protein HC891_07975 [Candidatus Gracilibacteria bacterium]|nr:hypothetical protein [Candidatus Gracilibacteria bacterium]